MNPESMPPYDPNLDPWNIDDEKTQIHKPFSDGDGATEEEGQLMMSPGAEDQRHEMKKHGLIGGMSDKELTEKIAETAELLLPELKRQAGDIRSKMIILADTRSLIEGKPGKEEQIAEIDEEMLRLQEEESELRRQIDELKKSLNR